MQKFDSRFMFQDDGTQFWGIEMYTFFKSKYWYKIL